MTRSLAGLACAAALTLCLAASVASPAVGARTAPRAGDPRSQWLNAVSLTGTTDGWAVGNADSFDSRPGNIAEHWDGSGWAKVKTPGVGHFGFLSGVAAVTPTDAWAVGSKGGAALVEHWDGRRWRVADSALQFNSYLLSASASGPDDAWAVGASSASFNEILEHWDGTAWTLVDGAAPQGSGLTDVEATSPRNAWASGYWGSVGAYSPLMEHWDGSRWTWSRPDFGAFPNDAQVNGISSTQARDAWVAGSFTDSDGVEHPLLAHWNGKKWRVVASPDLDGSLSEIHAVSADDVWAVGQVGTKTLIEHWDGSMWSQVDSPSQGTEAALFGLDATGPDDVVAVGGYLSASGARRPLALHWDGTAWMRADAGTFR